MHHFARSCQVKVQAKQAAQIKQIRNWFSYSKLWIFFFFFNLEKITSLDGVCVHFYLKTTAWEMIWPTLRIEHLTQMSDDLSRKNTLPPSDLKYSTKNKMLLLLCRSSCFNLPPHAMKDKLMPPPYISVQLQLSKCRFGSLSCVSINTICSLPRIDVRRGTVVSLVCLH